MNPSNRRLQTMTMIGRRWCQVRLFIEDGVDDVEGDCVVGYRPGVERVEGDGGSKNGISDLSLVWMK